MKIELKKLNAHGFSHIVLPLLVVVAVAAVGTYVLVKSHADPLTPVTSASSNDGWTYVGKAVLPQQNQVVTAFACKTNLSSTVQQVKGRFTLAASYKGDSAFAWQATITNNSVDPLKGYQVVTKNISDTTTPKVFVSTELDRQVSSPLTFSYDAGEAGVTPTVAGTLAQNVLPTKFATCKS